MLCHGLLYVVCWYVGVLPLKVGSCGRSRPQDVDFALRRSCLVVKITMYMCIHVHLFLICVSDTWALLLGLYGSYFYIVQRSTAALYLALLPLTGHTDVGRHPASRLKNEA